MQRQNEIQTRQPLLDANGRLQNPGWCRRNLYVYNREQIRANPYRLKEWDFYQISDGEKMVQLNFFNISLATCATFGFLDLQSGRKADCLSLQPLTPHKNRLPGNGDRPNRIAYRRGQTGLLFDRKETGGDLLFFGKWAGKSVEANFHFSMLPKHESLTIATPFQKPNEFFYTNKTNCLAAYGQVNLGTEQILFSAEKTFAVLDWGRGVWPHKNTWYWANGSTRLADGKLFGFELTWGFGNTEAATETALFYDGKCHKISEVQLDTDPERESSWMAPWHFTSRDGRLDLTMTPFYDHYTNLMPLWLFGMRTHQVHGLWNGSAILDDGQVLHIENMYAFCEKVHNKW